MKTKIINSIGEDVTIPIVALITALLFTTSIYITVLITQSIERARFAKTECARYNPYTSNFEVIKK